MGSIIDRAVTLGVRHFFLFTGTIGAFVAIPLAVALYATFAGEGAQIEAIIRAIEHGARTVPNLSPAASPLWQIGVADAAFFIVGALGSIGANAVALNVAAILSDAPPSFSHSTGRAFARAPQTLGVFGLGFLIGLGATILFGGVAVLVVLAIVEWYRLGMHSALALSACITAAIFLFAAILAIFMLLNAALIFAEFATVLERRRVVDAVATSFTRVFARGEWKRILLLTAVLGVVAMLIAFAGELAVAAFLAVGSLAAAGAAYLAAELVAMSLVAVFYAVYFCDIVDREAAAEPEPR